MITRIPSVGETIKVKNPVTGSITLYKVTFAPQQPYKDCNGFTELPGIIWMVDPTGKKDCIIAKFPDRFNDCIEIVEG